MVIAALIVFGALLAAWLLAPADRAGRAQLSEQRPNAVGSTLAEGLAEAA